ncbi:energy transducer TonB [Tropicimonas sp. S265A]|uniref:energy transducer TonB n=1 Tax=Tropicimonas sp. S265A TaxID=3415134 RepID=UPI003C79C932
MSALTRRFSTGTLVSGAGHLAIILWVILGGTLFRSSLDPVPATTNVTLISEAALEGREATRPEVVTDAPDAPQPAPVAEVPAPPPPPPVETPQAEPPEVSAPAPQAPPLPPPPADRVAPVPVPQPPEEAQLAETPQDAATPDGAGSEAAEPQEAEAPEAATTRIITEATETDPDSRSEEIALAPVSTPRPQARPNRPVRQPEPEPQPETPQDPIANAVAEAVAEASDTPPAADPTLPVGPPMTASERDGLRVAVQQCWNTGSLSSEALRTTVTVGVQMEQDGRPNVGSIRMIDAEGGSEAATQQAYEAARRAIIRCGARGFDLPVEKYAQWRDIEMTFNPERMRIR